MKPVSDQAQRIELRRFDTRPMCAFHCAWGAFFLCFFGWFGLAPLMGTIRDDLGLSREQVANAAIASVAVTILARLLFGWLCDRIGPRRSYTALLIVGSLPVMAVGLADSYATFLTARLAIGAIGASFVITQYHTTKMFAPACVGTANATAAGWGNLGGGVANMTMPLVLAALIGLGATPAMGWRLAMLLPGIAMLIAGVAYYRFTRDTPAGDLVDLRAAGEARPSLTGGLWTAAKDPRVLALAALYGACFGVEITFNNWAALYFHDRLGCSLAVAGLLAGIVGGMNLFARSLGGWLGDRCGRSGGIRGRALLLGAVVLGEGLALIAFAQAGSLALAIPCLVLFGLCVCMACGATFA
ncbi:MAG: MFS transporter, partial [Planctomycetes bacterium]|nr:MFS transporter [Planctomycetota bacterium]